MCTFANFKSNTRLTLERSNWLSKRPLAWLPFQKRYFGSIVKSISTLLSVCRTGLEPILQYLRSCNKNLTIFHTHTQIHSLSARALPDQILNYKHAIMMFKLFNNCQPENEFVQMNFQYNQSQRIKHSNFFIRQNYDSGKNILLNRLAHLNDKIEKSWLDQSLNTFKIKCKQLFLLNWKA